MKIFIFIVLFVLISCAKQKEEDKTSDITLNSTIPPQGFILSTSMATLNVGVAMTPITASYFGTIGEFRVSSDLPDGLSLNPSNGTISGVPTKSIPLSSYIITIYNPAGYQTQELNLIVNEPTPTNLNYNLSNLSLIRGDTSIILEPSNTGGKISSYSISPSLPSGLQINSNTGVISGIANENLANQLFTVTGVNPNGTTSYQFSIEVLGYAPSQLSYNFSTEYVNGDVVSIYPTYAGDLVQHFSISNNLPLGLNFNATNGYISGRILNNVDSSYTITAINDFGSSSYQFNLKATSSLSKVITTDINTCVLKDSNLLCSGNNDLIQYNNPSVCTGGDCISTFVPVKDNFGNDIKSFDFSLTKNNLCYIDTQQNIFCRGDNSKGQLGNTTVNSSSDFVPVKNELNENLKGYKIVNGLDFFCSLDFNRNVFCWGDNTYNQIKDSSLYLPLAHNLGYNDIKDIYVGKFNICIKRYFLQCRGLNNHQQLSSDSINGWVFSESSSGKFSDVLDVIISDSLINIKTNHGWFSSGLDTSGNSGVTKKKDTVISKFESSSFPNFNIFNKTYFIGDNFFLFDNEDLVTGGYESNDPVDFLMPLKAVNSLYAENKCFTNNLELYCFGSNLFSSLGNDSVLSVEMLQRVKSF